MSRITAKGLESRSRLLRAAAREFAARGYHETKVSDIVKAAGVTQAAFYLYFPSKETIFAELVQSFIGQLQLLTQSIEKVAPLSSAEVPNQIYLNFKSVFEFLASDPDLTRVAWYQSGETQRIKNLISQMMSPKISGNQKAGHLRPDLSPELIADCIIGMIDYITEKWILAEKKGPEEIAAEMVQVLLYGVLAR